MTGVAVQRASTTSPGQPRPGRSLALKQAALAGAAAGAWGAFAGYRIWRTVDGPPWIWQDSRSYIAAAHPPALSMAFLAGHRPPVVPLLWKVTGSPEAYVVTQTVLAVLAWSFLAWSVSRLVRAGWPAIVAGVAVLGFASCWQIIEWDWSVLSESISLSAVAVIVASIIWLARRFTLPRAAALVIACVVYEGARDQATWAVGAAALGVLAYTAVRSFRPRRAPVHATIRSLIALGLVLLASAGLTGAGAAHAKRNVINVEDVFDVRVFPFPHRVAWFARNGMPQAATIDTLASEVSASPGQAKVVGPNLQTPSWSPLERWFESRAETTFIYYVLTHPGYDLTAPFQRPELTYNNANGQLAFYGDINNGTRRFLPVLPAVLFPSWQTEAAIAIGASALLAARHRLRPSLVTALAIIALTGLASMLIAWQGDGMEVARHTIEGNVQTRLGVLVLVLVSALPLDLDRHAGKSRRTASALVAGPTPPEGTQSVDQ
jgi:hypothetical protein